MKSKQVTSIYSPQKDTPENAYNRDAPSGWNITMQQEICPSEWLRPVPPDPMTRAVAWNHPAPRKTIRQYACHNVVYYNVVRRGYDGASEYTAPNHQPYLANV